VTESLTTDLSRISGSFVIARNTAFTFKGKHFDVKQVGRDLNIRYVLEGSVQRGGNRLRINVQLIDAETGNHLWAERFDKPVADLFDMQDEIVARLANQLDTQLVAAEARRAEHNPNPDPMDLYFQGMAWLNKGPSSEGQEGLTHALALFERALALDPVNVDTLAGRAYVDALMVAIFRPDDLATRVAGAERAAVKALSLAPDHARAHLALGNVYAASMRNTQAIAACERALALDRNLVAALSIIGLAKIYLGRCEDVAGHMLEAQRLSPRDPLTFHWLFLTGWAKAHLEQDKEAITWLNRSIEANRNFPSPHFYLAASLVHLGRIEEAREAAKLGMALFPAFTIVRHRAARRSDDATYLAQCERFYDGLRKAGVPQE